MLKICSSKVVFSEILHFSMIFFNISGLFEGSTTFALWVSIWWSLISLEFFVNSSIFLSYPCLNLVWIHGNLEDSSSSLHVMRTIASVSSLSTIGKIYSIEFTIVIVIVVMTNWYPFNTLLLFHCPKESSVESPTANVFLSSSIEVVIIIEINIFS